MNAYLPQQAEPPKAGTGVDFLLIGPEPIADILYMFNTCLLNEN